MRQQALFNEQNKLILYKLTPEAGRAITNGVVYVEESIKVPPNDVENWVNCDIVSCKTKEEIVSSFQSQILSQVTIVENKDENTEGTLIFDKKDFSIKFIEV